jgi:hypothetical protein
MNTCCKKQKKENFANATKTTSSTGKTLMWIFALIFFIALIGGLVYWLKSKNLDIDLTRGFKSNLEIPGIEDL